MSIAPRANIIGIGCATPPGVSGQSQSARFAIETAGLQGDSARFAEVISARSGIASRASVLLKSAGEGDACAQSFFRPAVDSADKGPTTAERMSAYAAFAPQLAQAAAKQALAEAQPYLDDESAGSITHLVVVSCTGFSAPGLDVQLVRMLGLPATVERLTIGFMGCHGGLIGLRTARALAMAAPPQSPTNVLLVCVELCSLHFQYSARHDQIVANALFGDGAGAVVVSNSAGARHLQSQREHLAIHAAASTVLAHSEDAMTWTIGDHGFAMTLGESVPELIRSQLGPWLRGWLDSCGLKLEPGGDQLRWAIHPGGPRVLTAVGEALGLSAQALACSRAVLHDHGNMSSPTVLFTIQRLLATQNNAESQTPIVVIGFGPGLTAEATILR
jgi:predicted naringenin-chalcone synthase